MDSGNVAFMLLCTALVFFMTPGLALFYGGLVRRKNVINTMMSSIALIGLTIFMWIAVGYSLSFGGNHFGIIGDFRWVFLLDNNKNICSYAPTIPGYVFAAFQMMFAVITPALITGAVAGRMKFKALFIFTALWSLIVYYPLAHMVWGAGGYLGKLGAVDFAGGNVVHISSGISALILCIVLGKRKDYRHVSYHIHNIPMVAAGACILFFGWFGFNSGSALAADGLAAHAFMTTAMSAACAMLVWMLIEVIVSGVPSLIGTVTGMVAGLVAITPGAGFVPVWAAAIIGASVSPVCYFMISKVKKHFGYDDALDAFGCHGVGGIWGGIMTGIFTDRSINGAAKWNGLIYGEIRLFSAQFISIVITIGIAAVGTSICIAVVKFVTTLRVSKREELTGLDMSEHGENAYPSFNGLE